MAHALGYARVSTGEQDARLQHDALTAAGCYRFFTDTASGALQSHPELDKLLDQLRPGDTLVVSRLDRDIDFRSLQENINNPSSVGWLVFHLFGGI